MDRDAAEEIADQFESVALASGGGGRGGKKGGRGGRGGGGAGRGGREVQLSKALSKLLRHQAGSAGIELDDGGFAQLDKVLQWGPIRSLQPPVTFSEVLQAVRDSDKQRFALKPNPDTNPDLDETLEDASKWLIRANQGHSIKLDSDGLLKPIALPNSEGKIPDGSVPVPEMVVHGTYFAFWPKIVESGGLKPMGRNHVHFSIGLPEDKEGVISGMRKDAEVLVYVDVEKSLKEGDGGMKWWMSENGVVLTEGDKDGLVPTGLFKEVVGRRQDVGVLMRDGEEVAYLPEGLKIKAPMGKGRGGRGGGRGGRGGKR
ncbi:KptA family-domain-containing protein [Cladorrhinum sp. PSN332]|nr:KptA family-domain-containing protein [Cladorrhinum sp. PSN332]